MTITSLGLLATSLLSQHTSRMLVHRSNTANATAVAAAAAATFTPFVFGSAAGAAGGAGACAEGVPCQEPNIPQNFSETTRGRTLGNLPESMFLNFREERPANGFGIKSERI
mmetsp:Transcript_20832/g.45287  ORF Transcript_20832/g.45287 Transcript_20832/m.45287 type:complete len:112 (+) Transcript_20832:384-719(+)